MALFVLRRFAILIASVFAASVLVFVVLAALPGDAAEVQLGDQATPEALAALRHELGLDVPLVVQYGRWMGGVVRGDLGTSYVSSLPVGAQIRDRLFVTGPLALFGMTLAVLIAAPAGVYSAAHHRRLGDAVVSALTQLGMAVPAFWAGIMLITLVSVKLHWLPAGGFVPWGQDVGGALRSLVLPAVSIALVQGAILTRYVRSAVLDVLREDYIRTARARGRTRTGALVRHGLRNAAIPVVTVLGLQLSFLIAGAVVVENVFFLPGLGRMLLRAIGDRDLLLVQGTVLMLTVVVLVVNFLVDLAYHYLDPRLRTAT